MTANEQQGQNEIITYWQQEIERLTREISADALDVADGFEKERTGIRDGDGCWHGSDVYGFLLYKAVPGLRHRFQKLYADLKHANARLLECERIVSTGNHADDVPVDDTPF